MSDPSRVAQVKSLVKNFKEQLADLLGLPVLEELGVQYDQVPEKSSSGISNHADSNLLELSDLAVKMADIVSSAEISNSAECPGDSEVHEYETEVRLHPGLVAVYGPPGTEPVLGQSQTRFDDKESLVYSRVSQDISISREFIHHSRSLQYIPPKDTPPVTAEVFAKPWSKRKRAPQSTPPDYCLSSGSISRQSSRSSSIISDDTSVSFDDDDSIYSPQRQAQIYAKLRKRNRKGEVKSDPDTSATSALKSEEDQKSNKMWSPDDVGDMNASEQEDEEVKIHPKRRGKKVRPASPIISGNKNKHIDKENRNSSVKGQVAKVDGARERQRQETKQISDSEGSGSDVLGDMVAANVDICTSPETPKSQSSISENIILPKENRVEDVLLRSGRRGECSLSSVKSDMSQLVDNLQEAFNKKSSVQGKKNEKQTNKLPDICRSRSTSVEPAFSERDSSLEPGFVMDSKVKLRNLRKKPQVVVSKLNIGDVQKKLAVSRSPSDSKPGTPVKKEAERDSSNDPVDMEAFSPVSQSPVRKTSPRVTPDRVLRSGKTRMIKLENTRESPSKKQLDSSKGEKSSSKSKEIKVEKVVKKEKEVSPVKAAKKEVKHARSVSSCDSSSVNDISISDVENVIPSYPSPPSHMSVSKSRSTTPVLSSPVKKTSDRIKRVLNLSQLSSDSDFDETPVKKKKKKMVMRRCSSEDEERPIIQTTPLTVRFSRKDGLKVNSEEPECEDTSTLMDWESWNKKNRKKLVLGSSKSKGKPTEDSGSSDGPSSEETTETTANAKGPLSGKQKNVREKGSNGTEKSSSDREKSSSSKEKGSNDGMKSSIDKQKDLKIKREGSIDKQSDSDSEDGSDGERTGSDRDQARKRSKQNHSDENEGASKLKVTPENPPSRSDSPAIGAQSHSNTPSDFPEYTVSVTEEVKPLDKDFPPEIKCIACGRSIHWATQHVHDHPRLEVLICQNCHRTVTSGEFSLGETNEEYCSLCGDGGQIVLCDFCDKSFCYSCVARISGAEHLKHLLKDEEAAFKCYICDDEPLRGAREDCRRLAEHLERSKVPSIRAYFKKKKTKTSANNAKDDKTVENKEQDSGDTKIKSEELRSEKKGKAEGKKKWSLRSKGPLTPAVVEEEDTSSDASNHGGKSPEVHTDDVMSESNLGDELAKRKKRKSLAKQKNKDSKDNKHSSGDEDARNSGSGENADDSGKAKKKLRKRRKNLLDRCSSQVQDDSSDSGGGTSSSSFEAVVNDAKKSSSSSTSSNNSSSESEEEEVKKKKDGKSRGKKSRLASYTSGSESESDRALQIHVSDQSVSDQGDETLDQMKEGSSKEVKYRIAGDSDSSLDSPLTSDIEPLQRKKKRRDPLKTLTTSDDEVSEIETRKPKKRISRKRKRDESSPGDGSDEDDFMDEDMVLKGRSRRRRQLIKQLLTSDSEDENEDSDQDEEVTESQEDPKGKKRRKIRKLIGDAKLTSETKQALQEERERTERLKKRKQMIKEEGEEDKLILEQDSETKEVKLEVRRSLVSQLKPHQKEGIKFLFDACVESIDRLAKGQANGAILAHCMGLGKTLQVIGFVDALLSCDKDVIKRVLILCPINTIYNWKAEYLKWISYKDMEYNLYLVNEPNRRVSIDKMRKWYFNGGVLFMGYERFRNLALCKRAKRAKQKAELQKFLLNPGADLVVCDEGHVMRNSNSSTSISINMIRTKLRVVLTGTPLQNNLQEYYTMVNFVKPNLLGTSKEFKNRFVNPITNGQCRDSSAEDIRMMKHRAHVLYSLLKDTVQRKDFRVLTKTLPPKLEYVLNIRLSPVQDSLYRRYLDKERGSGGFKSTSLFSTFAALAKIWNHPWVLKMDKQRKLERDERKELYGLSEDDDYDDDDEDKTLGGFIVSDSDLEEDFDTRHKKHKKNSKSKKPPLTSSSSSLSNSISGTPTPLTPVTAQNGIIAISSDSDAELLPKIKIKAEPGTFAAVSSSSVAKTAEPRTSEMNGPTSGKSEREEKQAEEQEHLPKKPSDWYDDLLGDGADEKLEMSGKLLFLFELLEQTRPLKEKVLVFSQSLLTLDLIEEFLSRPEWGDFIYGVDYCRLDGSSAADLRTANMTEFNKTGNDRLRLFLISTRAGSLGVNLVAANRVVIFDACWNPSHDLQAIFRTYRYGQTKPVFVYRLLAQGTMEEKIYDRQVTKESLSMRVVDEKQIGRHFSASDLSELFLYTPAPPPDPNAGEPENASIENDIVLNAILEKIQAKWVVNYHQHDSLLEHIDQEELSEEERQLAWQQYKQQMNMENARYNMEVLQNAMSFVNPATPQPPPGMAPGISAPPTSAAPMPGGPVMSVNTGGLQINPYDTFKVKNVTGLVSQALEQVKQIKMNYNNLQHLKRLCANAVAIPLVHRSEINRLQGLVNQGTHNLHGKIQLVNDAIARFQACSLALHPMYTRVVNEYRQSLYKALEELRLIAGGNQTMPSSGVHMSGAVSTAPPVSMVTRVGEQSHVTSTTDLV